MRFTALVLAVALPIALSACGQDETAPAETNGGAANAEPIAAEHAANDDAAVAPSGAQAFVNKVAASDRFEIETSKLVASSAASTALMDFARQMIAAHTASTAKLKAAAGSSVTTDDSLSPSQQATLEDLKSKKGYIFDAAYISAQVYAHDQTLNDLKNYAASGDNPALKEFAQGMAPTVEEHLNKAKALVK